MNSDWTEWKALTRIIPKRLKKEAPEIQNQKKRVWFQWEDPTNVSDEEAKNGTTEFYANDYPRTSTAANDYIQQRRKIQQMIILSNNIESYCGESNLIFSFFQYYFAVFSFCVSVILCGAISLANLCGVIICD